MRSYSSSVSLAGFVRMESGTASFPMSWNMPPNLIASSSLGVRPSSSPTATAIRCTRRECPAVYGSLASTVAFSVSTASNALSSRRS